MKVSELQKYKESCYSALSRDLSEFEKNFLFMSVGVLTFSSTYINKVLEDEGFSYIVLLIVAWFFLISSTGLMMYSFMRAVAANNSLLRTINSFENKYDLFDQEERLSDEQARDIRSDIQQTLNSTRRTLRTIRSFSIWTFLLGLTLLCVFVSINIVEKKSRSSSQSNFQTIITEKNERVNVTP